MKYKCSHCERFFDDKKSKICHQRWHDLPKYKEYQDKFKKAVSESRMGNKNPMWKEDSVGYGSLHEWARNHLPKPKVCECCKKAKPFDLANISNEYKRDLSDWEWLCRRCHMVKDGRLEKFKTAHLKRRKVK